MNIKIVKEAYQKLRYFTELCDTEISGLGKVRKIDINQLEIYDIEIFEQNTSYSHSTLNEDALAKFLNEKVTKNENISDYKVWWHSHTDMEAYFSPKDESTIDSSTEFPYLISIVTNKRGQDKARLDIYKPLRLTIPLEIKLSLEQDEKLKQKCQTEIKEKVKTRWSILTLGDRRRYSTPKFFKKI